MKNIQPPVDITPVPDKEVQREVFDLSNDVDTVYQRVGEMLDRLAPVMTKSKLAESDTKEPECETEIGRSLQSVRMRLENVSAFLADILERLEV